MKKKAEITFEIEETTVIRLEARTITEFCPQCQALVEMASPQFIATWSNFTEREIFRLIEAGEIHFIETERIAVCLNSIRFLQGARQNEK